MLKQLDGVYKKGRSKDWLKFKSELDTTLEITGWFEGAGKRSHTVGGLLLSTSCGTLTAKVGSGLGDEMLKLIKASIDADTFHDEFVGKLVDVRYNTVKKGSDPKLYLPRFFGQAETVDEFLRTDINEADSYEKLLSQQSC